MQSRIKNPALSVPGAIQALLAVGATVDKSNVPKSTLLLQQLRASQINGCSVCTDMHARDLKKLGETEERMWSVAAWRESPLFNDAERAALALCEAATRISDRSDPVPDAVWEEAARHYDEPSLAALVLNIAMINLWNRINVTIHEIVPVGGVRAAVADAHR